MLVSPAGSRLHLQDSILKKWSSFSLSILIVILLLQTLLFSINVSNSIFGLYDRQQGLASLIYYLLFFYLFVKTIKLEQLNRILIAITLPSFFVSVYGIAQRSGWDFVKWTEPASLTHRIFSAQGQPIFLASYLVLVLPITLHLFFSSKSRLASIFYFFTIILSMAALILTYSFGGVIGLAFELTCIFLFLFFYLQRRKKFISCHPRASRDLVNIVTSNEIPAFAGMTEGENAGMTERKNVGVVKKENAKSGEGSYMGIKLYSSFLILLILFSGFLVYNFRYDWALSSKIKSLISWQGSSAQMRTIYWQSSLSAIKDQPWVGYGLENQEQVLTKYYDKQWAELEFVNMSTNRAHNILLDILLTSGLLGLILFLLCLYFLGKIIFTNWKKSEYKLLSVFLGIAILSLLLTLQFSFLSVTLGIYLALFFGILFIVNRGLPDGQEETKFPIGNLVSESKLIVLVKIIVGCGAIAICSYLITLNFNKIITDSYFRELLTVDQEGDFFAMINLYDYIKASEPSYDYYDQQLVEIMNNEADHWSNPAAKINYTKDRLERIIKNNPAKTFSDILTQARVYAMLTIIDKSQESFSNSKLLYEKAIKFSPGFPESQYELADLLARAKDYNDAKAQYLVFLSKLPDVNSSDMNSDHRQAVISEMVKGYIGLGDICTDLKDWAEANKYYQQVIVFSPKNPLVYYKIGRLYYLQHDFKQAIWYNNKAGDLDPNNYFYPYITALFYKEMGNKQTAINYAQQALKLNPRASEALELIWELGK